MRSMIKTCPYCQHENHAQEFICEKCGEDISRVKAASKEPVPAEATSTAPQAAPSPQAGTPSRPQPEPTRRAPVSTAQLVCEQANLPPFTIMPNTTIGREIRKPGDVDLSQAPNSDYVSRQHATFMLQGTRWFVRPERTMNGTWLNEEQLPEGQLREIRNNDRLRLGMATFIFKI